MPRSTIPSDYGPEYRMLLLTAWSHIQTTSPEYIFHLPDPRSAMIMRRKMYAYFNAVKLSAAEKEKDAKKLMEIVREVTLKTIGPTLQFSRKRDAWDNVLIRTVLGLSDDFDRLPESAIGGLSSLHPTPKPITPSGMTPMDALQRVRARNMPRIAVPIPTDPYDLQHLTRDDQYPSNSD